MTMTSEWRSSHELGKHSASVSQKPLNWCMYNMTPGSIIIIINLMPSGEWLVKVFHTGSRPRFMQQFMLYCCFFGTLSCKVFVRWLKAVVTTSLAAYKIRQFEYVIHISPHVIRLLKSCWRHDLHKAAWGRHQKMVNREIPNWHFISRLTGYCLNYLSFTWRGEFSAALSDSLFWHFIQASAETLFILTNLSGFMALEADIEFTLNCLQNGRAIYDIINKH